MKNRSGTYGDTKKTLPLEGGGKRVGVKGLTGIAKALRKQTTYPHPNYDTVSRGRGEIIFDNTGLLERRKP